MQHYLFVHFKEKRTPDGEQVYFALSRDGFHWDAVNQGQPVLWSMLGEKGVRDFTIIRSVGSGQTRFYILATDLSLSYCLRTKYQNDWRLIKKEGSTSLMMWESDDLCHWSEQKALRVKEPGTGCCWAPDAIRDKNTGEFIIHWSSPNPENEGRMAIYYTRTKDFRHFTDPQLLFARENGAGCIDSCMVEEKGVYYLWVKSENDPVSVLLYRSGNITGPFERMESFEPEMRALSGNTNCYEAPTACRLPDGSYNLFLDYFGVSGAGQGYVPFHSEDISTGVFQRCDKEVSTPYGFKHGTILPITEEEYERVKNFDYEAESYNR